MRYVEGGAATTAQLAPITRGLPNLQGLDGPVQAPSDLTCLFFPLVVSSTLTQANLPQV